MRFSGKVVVVTGAAAGIGREIMKKFIGEGAFVVVADIDLATAKEVCAEINNDKLVGIAIETDISIQSQVEQMVEDVMKRFGKIDILINNAGISGEVAFLDMEVSEWQRVLDVNLTGQFITSQVVANKMVESGVKGKIINITSINSEIAGSGLSHYCAAKGGLKMLTKVMALELSPYRINVNAVAPGIIETQLTASSLADPEKKEKLLSNVPFDRVGQPSDVAGTVLFLASEDADYITGATHFVDGGWLA